MKHFFDIGGNVGQTFDWIETQGGRFDNHRFWVFEPSPRHFAKLLEKCRVMSAKYDIVLCPFGVRGSYGIAPFYSKDDDRGDSFEEHVTADHPQENLHLGFTIVAAVHGLPWLINVLTEPDDTVFLDIDAEGAEYDMLESLLTDPALVSRVSGIIAEFHNLPVLPLPDRNSIERKHDIQTAFKKHGIEIVCRGSVP